MHDDDPAGNPAGNPADNPAGAPPRPRKQYEVFVAEREVATPRSVAFAAACDLIDEATGGAVVDGHPEPHGVGARFEFTRRDRDLYAEVISFEPPWRRVYELSGAPVALYQGTLAITDRIDSCLMAWSILVDPLPDGGSDAFLDGIQPSLEEVADRAKALAEAT